MRPIWGKKISPPWQRSILARSESTRLPTLLKRDASSCRWVRHFVRSVLSSSSRNWCPIGRYSHPREGPSRRRGHTLPACRNGRPCPGHAAVPRLEVSPIACPCASRWAFFLSSAERCEEEHHQAVQRTPLRTVRAAGRDARPALFGWYAAKVSMGRSPGSADRCALAMPGTSRSARRPCYRRFLSPG